MIRALVAAAGEQRGDLVVEARAALTTSTTTAATAAQTATAHA
jgi:hypothetical protein